jgi:hypothetical protein
VQHCTSFFFRELDKMKLASKLKWGAVAGLVALTTVIAACGGSDQVDSGPQRVKHVFVITLENKDYNDSFVTSTQNPYLQKTLPAMGALLTQYYGTGHASLTNYIAMLSGQPVTPESAADCTTYSDFVQTGTSADGLAVGHGCVYPAAVQTLPNQLKAAGMSWRGYMEDMGNDPTRESATCGHPVIGTADQTNHQMAPSAAVPKGDQYAARHNPFVYFHSIIDTPECQTNVVALDKLESDIAKIETTPNFVFITPNVCNDGHDGDGTGATGKGCINGQPGGLKSADEFLKLWVPKILASEAYKKDGLLIINFDESGAAASQTVTVDASGMQHVTVSYNSNDACCNQQPGPNVSYPLALTFPVSATMQYDLKFPAPGGGRTGAVLLSPFIKPGTVSNVGYNHYSLLKSIEQIFKIKDYLGYANQAGLASFGDDIYTN